MDVDVELHKPLDSLLAHQAFFAFETRDSVNGAIIGAVPNNPCICDILSSFDKDFFIKANGKPDLKPIPVRITKTLRKRGLRLNGKTQTLKDGTMVLPANELTLDIGDDSCIAEHHYESSWVEGKMKTSYKDYVAKDFYATGIMWQLYRALKRMLGFLGLRHFLASIIRKFRRKYAWQRMKE